jgi:hypothetical protein
VETAPYVELSSSQLRERAGLRRLVRLWAPLTVALAIALWWFVPAPEGVFALVTFLGLAAFLAIAGVSSERALKRSHSQLGARVESEGEVVIARWEVSRDRWTECVDRRRRQHTRTSRWPTVFAVSLPFLYVLKTTGMGERITMLSVSAGALIGLVMGVIILAAVKWPQRDELRNLAESRPEVILAATTLGLGYVGFQWSLRNSIWLKASHHLESLEWNPSDPAWFTLKLRKSGWGGTRMSIQFPAPASADEARRIAITFEREVELRRRAEISEGG